MKIILQLQLLSLLFVNFHFVVPHKAKTANQDGRKECKKDGYK